VVAYELLTGRVPFTGRTPQSIAFAQVHREPPSPRLLRPDLPEAIERVVQRQLAKHPSARYPTAAAFVRDLSEAIRETGLDVRIRAALDGSDLPLAEALLTELAARDPGFAALPALRRELEEQQRREIRSRVVERLDADDRPAALALIERLRALGDPDTALLERIARAGPLPPSQQEAAPPPTIPAAQPTAPTASATPTVPPAPRPSPVPPPARGPAVGGTTPARATPVPVPPLARTERRPLAAARAATESGVAASGTAANPDDTPTRAVLLDDARAASGKRYGLLTGTALVVVVVGVVLLARPWANGAEAPATAPAGSDRPTPATAVAGSGTTLAATSLPVVPTAVQPLPQPTSTAAPAPATATLPPPTAVPQTPTPGPAQRLAEADAILAGGDSGRALELVQAVKQSDPTAPGLNDLLYRASMAHAKRLLDAGELDAAWGLYAQALELRPDDAAAKDGQKQIVLAKNWRTMESAWGKDDDAALGAAQEIAQIDLGYRETRDKLYTLLIARADRLLAAGDRAGAYAALMQAIEVRPDAPEARSRLQSYTPTPVIYVPPTSPPRQVQAPAQAAPAQAAPVDPAPAQAAPAQPAQPAPVQPVTAPVQPAAGTPVRR
jgi:hypothetical protein